MLSFNSVELKLISGSVFKFESGSENVDRHALAHNLWMDTNSENNVGQAVSYNSGFKLIKGRVFESEARKHNMDRYVHTQKQANGRTPIS